MIFQPTVDGQTIVSLSADGKYCGRSFFRAQHHFYYGRCQSLEIPQCLQSLVVSEMLITLNTGMDVYVHDRSYFLHPTTNFKVSVDLGQFLVRYQI